ncbi:MAG: hypothetical protein HY481_02125 [Candidatus Vogelbacteria bacterium]|nr:hypothetical protein [Candidatus Vogelbacteria bacterium]
MDSFLKKIKDSRLSSIIDVVQTGDTEHFKKIQEQFPEYDVTFLWLLCYPHPNTERQRKYIEKNFEKFNRFLDSGYPSKLSSKGRFVSHMWEMILCDTLQASGELVPKTKSGVDFHIKDPKGGIVQIEAVAPDEAGEEKDRSVKPDFLESGVISMGGDIEDMERPILLRVFDKGFIEKAGRKSYDKDKPLIIAINSSKTVGMISDDEYVLRRVLFGLGYVTITRDSKGVSHTGFQQNPKLNKLDEQAFDVAVFRNPEYKHVSGIIYTSQRPLGFIPQGFSWHNSGITFVPNPMATHPVNLSFPFFKTMLCNEKEYRFIDAERKFQSVLFHDF